jgi:CheY-like chemotaxis protein
VEQHPGGRSVESLRLNQRNEAATIRTPPGVPDRLRERTDAVTTCLCHSWRVGRTVLIVDDHPRFRAAARALLEEAGFDVAGEAGDGASALAAAAVLAPEIILLDVHLPDLDGFAVAERLVAGGVYSAIVLTSSRDVSSFRRRLAANPDWSFIAKSDLSGEALAAAVG